MVKFLNFVMARWWKLRQWSALTHSVYYFGYALFLALPDLTIEVNYFDDLNKNKHSVIKSTADDT